MNDKGSTRDLFYSPGEVAKYFVDYAARLRDFPGLRWGVASMDRSIVPMKPGDLIGVIARPGHGKSTLMAYLARKTAKDIKDAGRENECVVYVSFEQAIEEIEAVFQSTPELSVTDIAWGRADLEQIRTNSVQRVGLPVWLMGRSMERRKRLPRMTIDNVYRALAEMEEDYKIKPALIVLDYIQIVPIERAAERVTQVSEAIVRAKELAAYVAAPIVVGVQAGRAVDTKQQKIPGPADCQWASAIEQAADKLIGIWRPVLTEDKDAIVKINGSEIRVTQQLLIAKLLKQRMAPAGDVFPLHFAPEYVRLTDLELRDIR